MHVCYIIGLDKKYGHKKSSGMVIFYYKDQLLPVNTALPHLYTVELSVVLYSLSLHSVMPYGGGGGIVRVADEFWP